MTVGCHNEETGPQVPWHDWINRQVDKFFMPIWWTLLVVGTIVVAVGFHRIPTVH